MWNGHYIPKGSIVQSNIGCVLALKLSFLNLNIIIASCWGIHKSGVKTVTLLTLNAGYQLQTHGQISYPIWWEYRSVLEDGTCIKCLPSCSNLYKTVSVQDVIWLNEWAWYLPQPLSPHSVSFLLMVRLHHRPWLSRIRSYGEILKIPPTYIPSHHFSRRPANLRSQFKQRQWSLLVRTHTPSLTYSCEYCSGVARMRSVSQVQIDCWCSWINVLLRLSWCIQYD